VLLVAGGFLPYIPYVQALLVQLGNSIKELFFDPEPVFGLGAVNRCRPDRLTGVTPLPGHPS
jgi:hypothetical protein